MSPQEAPKEEPKVSPKPQEEPMEEPDVSKYEDIGEEVCNFSDPMKQEVCERLLKGYEEIKDEKHIQSLKRSLGKESEEAGNMIDAKSRIFEKKTVDDPPILTEYKNIVYKEGKPILEFTTSYGADVAGSSIDGKSIKFLNK